MASFHIVLSRPVWLFLFLGEKMKEGLVICLFGLPSNPLACSGSALQGTDHCKLHFQRFLENCLLPTGGTHMKLKLEGGRRGETRVFLPLSQLWAASPAIAVFLLWSRPLGYPLPQCPCRAALAPQPHRPHLLSLCFHHTGGCGFPLYLISGLPHTPFTLSTPATFL